MANDYMYVFSTTGSTWSVVVAPCIGALVAFDSDLRAFDLTLQLDFAI